tara:strand:+ start:121 stop:831 length:711 start_codon:yes stop_codon:yes gene_type:complete
MRKTEPAVTIITPTTGKHSLYFLIDSIKKQGVPVHHLLLWDDFRQDEFMTNKKPSDLLGLEDDLYLLNNIEIKASTVQGMAKGSALRAIGLMAAQTEFVCFADDDIAFEEDHLISLMELIHKEQTSWGYCKRKIWSKTGRQEYEYLGIDEFESVGDDARPELGYQMVDNSCMMFRRKFGASAACLYRETTAYNDDRLMYDFLIKYAGAPSKTREATINQVCPNKLHNFFKVNCTNE